MTYTSGRTSLFFAVIARISEEQFLTNDERIPSFIRQGERERGQEGKRESGREREEKLKEG
jgi:hypothetical protein